MKRKLLSAEYAAMDDHSLLVSLCVSHDDLKEHFENHLAHHWKISCLAFAAALSGIVSFGSSLILFLIKGG